MKKIFCAGIIASSLLLVLAGFASRAVAKEPTIDERFRDANNSAPNATNNASESELPLLSPPQSKLVQPARDFARPNFNTPNVGNVSGPAYLGVTFGDDERSAVVRTVAPGSPAEQAGLKPGDTIESLQGITIAVPQDVLDIIGKMRPGTMLDVGVSRRVNLHAQAPLAPLPGPTLRSAGYPPEDSSNTYEAPTELPRELMPVPPRGPSNQFNQPRSTQPNRNVNAVPQRQNPQSNGQRNNANQNNNRSNDNRGLLFNRGRR